MAGVDRVELFKLMGTIAVDANQAHKAIDDTTEKADNAGKKTSNAFATIGSAALKVGTAVVTAGAALGGAWLAAIEGTREYRAEMGKLETAFATAGYTTEAATSSFKTLFGVIGETDQAVEAAQQIALLADSEKDVAQWSELAAGVVGRFGDALQPETFFESANETIKLGEATGVYVQMLEGVGMSVEDFNEGLASCSTESEKQAYMLGITKEALGEASKTYNEANKDIIAANKAQERLTSAMAELGRIGEPILTAIKDKVADMALAAIPHIENFVKKVKDLKKWIKDNEKTIDTWGAVIIGATVSIGTFLLILNWGAIMAAAAKAVNAVRNAILLFNTALLANPIALVVALIAGLVAAFIYLLNNNKDFRAFWINLWDKIKSTCSSAVGWIKDKFADFKAALSTVKTTFENIKQAIADKLDSARDKVRSAIDKIKGFFNFKWSLPKLKMPSITVTGKFSLNPPSVPKFKWNAKGGILTQPTIFGRMGDTLLGGGEAGAEAIAPITVLQDYIRQAVSAENEGIRDTLIEQTGLLLTFLSQNMPKAVMLDTGAMVGELTPAIDAGLANRWNNTKRGNTR